MKKELLIVSLLAVFLIGFGSGLFTGNSLAAAKLQNLEQENSGQNSGFLPENVLEPLDQARLDETINIVAVNSEGRGIISTGEVEIVPGKGRVLFNTNPFVEPDTQNSLETAKRVAEKYTGKSLAEKDVIYSVQNSGAELIGGPSAGAAFTVATIAAIQGLKIREDSAITGTIEENGLIGEIGGVAEKLQAAGESGKKLFVIPKGQSIVTYYERQVTQEQRGFLTITRSKIVPKTLDLVEFAKQWDLEVKEAQTIYDAVEFLTEDSQGKE
ncbi:MAG: S16 family serine protease [Candidatus Diapherotrites archaeon]|nr:S16 family serine protease [Candidatus Diapherotrites archaeon]